MTPTPTPATDQAWGSWALQTSILYITLGLRRLYLVFPVCNGNVIIFYDVCVCVCVKLGKHLFPKHPLFLFLFFQLLCLLSHISFPWNTTLIVQLTFRRATKLLCGMKRTETHVTHSCHKRPKAGIHSCSTDLQTEMYRKRQPCGEWGQAVSLALPPGWWFLDSTVHNHS